MHRHKAGLLNTEFKQELGKVAWHVPCHQRVQNIGPKTRDVLALVPGTEIEIIERCSGHDGTYGVRAGTYERSQKIARPVISRVQKMERRLPRIRLPHGRHANRRRTGTEARRNQPTHLVAQGVRDIGAVISIRIRSGMSDQDIIPAPDDENWPG